MPREDFSNLEGHIIPRSFRPGFIILSYLISYVGSWTTLELINRRTSIRGSINWLILAASSFSMGGVGTWCMHFIGNRAVILGHGQPQIQIAYNTFFTVLSFFLPVTIIFIAFGSFGSNERVTIIRIILGGILTALGLLGMHYLGQAGIWNYECFYSVPWVLAAFVVAKLACVAGLAPFFMFRSSWNSSWWKRALCALALSASVSAVHWFSSIGTSYRLIYANSAPSNESSMTMTVIVVIILSIIGCLALLGFAIIAQRRINLAARRAQQLVLAAAIFDHDGKLLVTTEGLLPIKKITEKWLERSLDDVFNISHPVFLWMFRTSRNWNGVSNLIYSMRSHVHRSGIRSRLGSRPNILLNNQGTPIQDYSLVFRELFCLTAADLAADLNQPLENIGVLYDEIINTGQVPKVGAFMGKKSNANITSSVVDLEGDGTGLPTVGKGQLLFLVRRAGRREAKDLLAAGYRFANFDDVAPILTISLQLRLTALRQRFKILQEYSANPRMLEPGIHFAIFAVRASLGVGRKGFDILARKDAKNQLATMKINVKILEDWHVQYFKKMENMTVTACIRFLYKAAKPNNHPKAEQVYAKTLLESLEALKDEINDPIFNDAQLIGKPFKAPCRGGNEDSPLGTALLITFKIILPIHGRAPGKKLEFIPLNFFKISQHIHKNSKDHAIFARKTYREFQAVLKLGSESQGKNHSTCPFRATSGCVSTRASAMNSRNEAKIGDSIDIFGNPCPQLHPMMQSSGPSKIGFWNQTARLNPEETQKLVDQEPREMMAIGDKITTHVENSLSPGPRSSAHSVMNNRNMLGAELVYIPRGKRPTGSPPSDDEEGDTFVDEIFRITIATRHF